MINNIEKNDNNTYDIKAISEEVGIGKNKLFSGLRELGILNNDNTIKEEFLSEGLIQSCTFKNFIGKVPILLANRFGVEFIKKLVAKEPEIFNKKQKRTSRRLDASRYKIMR